MIKYTTQRIIQVQDWDRLVRDTYGRPYNFQQQDDCMDKGLFRLVVTPEVDDSHLPTFVPEELHTEVMGVQFKAWLARDPEIPLVGQRYDSELSLWYHRNFYPAIEVIASDLLKRGLIEEGEYLINIDW